MQVAGAAVAGVDPGERHVGRVGDHIVADPVAVSDDPLPPGQHRSTLVRLDAEVGRYQPGKGLLPDRLTAVVDDHRTGLRVVGRVVGGEEDQARSDALAGRVHDQRRDLKVRARVVGGCTRSDGRFDQGTERARDVVAGGREREGTDARATGSEQLAPGEPRGQGCRMC